LASVADADLREFVHMVKERVMKKEQKKEKLNLDDLEAEIGARVAEAAEIGSPDEKLAGRVQAQLRV
jgi:hypothetical protein